MIWLQVVVDMACGACFSLGGHGFLWMRRYLMPVILAITVSILSHTYWIGLTTLPVIATLCLGYSGTGWLGRGSWLGLQAALIGFGLVLTSHLLLWIYLIYCAVAFVLGATLYLLKQPIGDAIFGCWLGIIILFIK